MTLGQKQSNFTLDLANFIIFANKQGFDVRLREVGRTDYQHAENIRLGLTKAKRSLHQDNLAFDAYFVKGGITYGLKREDKAVLQPLGNYWEKLRPGNKWGGNFTSFLDLPHFEHNA